LAAPSILIGILIVSTLPFLMKQHPEDLDIGWKSMLLETK